MHLPRLAHTLSRPRISLWLARHSHAPLRMLIAPAGAGKTSALIGYLRSQSAPFVYCVARADLTEREVFDEIARALGTSALNSFDDLIAAFIGRPPLLLAFESIDAAPENIRALLLRIVEEGADNVACIATARNWDVLPAERLAVRGLAAICDDRTIAFTAEEVRLLAGLFGVPCEPVHAQQLIEDTEGWAIVVAGAVREAFENGRSLANAYDHWRKAQSHAFRSFVEFHAERADGPQLDAWDHFVAHGSFYTQSSAEQLRRAGLPVWRDLHGNHFSYRVAEQLFTTQLAVASIGSEKSPQLLVRVLGEFHAGFGKETIRWIRRRDQQIFFYLLLKEDGSASRLELCDRFWAGVEPELRNASLRVACSNIRRAIAAVAGAANVDRYFKSSGDIAVNFANVTVDARRFRRHVSDGDAQYHRGNHQEALAHYRMAEALYGGRVGWFSHADEWVVEQAALYESLYAGVVERLTSLHRRAEDSARVAEYARIANAKMQKPAEVPAPRAC